MPITIPREYHSTGAPKEEIKDSLPTPAVLSCFQVVSKIQCQVPGFRINCWDSEEMAREPVFILFTVRHLAT